MTNVVMSNANMKIDTSLHMYLFCHLPSVSVMSYRLCHVKACLAAYADREGPNVYASSQSGQGLHCQLQESLDIIDRINGAQRPG